MGWFEQVTGRSKSERDAYNKNKNALGGATINQRNLDTAAKAGLLGKNKKGETVRNDGYVVIDRNNDIAQAWRGSGSGNPSVRYNPELPGGRPRDATDLIRPGSFVPGQSPSIQPPGTPPAGAGAGSQFVRTWGGADYVPRSPNAPAGDFFNVPSEYFGEKPGQVYSDGTVHLPTAETLGTTPIYVGGREAPRNTGNSDIAAWEERYGDAELGTPTWFATWGVFFGDAVTAVNQGKDWVGERFIKDPIDTFVRGVPDLPEDKGHQTPIANWLF